MKKCIIIGASSGIGREIARLLIDDGWQLGIAARRREKLMETQQLAPDRVFIREIDVTDSSAAESLNYLINSVGGMNLFIYSAGIGWQNRELEEEKELATVQTNATGFVRMTGEAYRYMARNGGGQIACISSIAGTMGLGPAPAYSATKAMQQTYLEALQQQANQRRLNIQITDIRPGFVDTDLLGHAHYPMMMKVADAARLTLTAIKKRKPAATIDWRWRLLTRAWKMIPKCIWRKMKIS